uniref:CHCH domain-containing protein n=1 Tax=Piliocolobus tephrosceles TaxID=591936 RepID=A0A8C9HIU1_9PRIM
MDKKRSIVKKPDRGSFLLDHNSECTSIKNKYLKCLKKHNNDHLSCRNYSKEYFICRMDKNLLERQDLNELGFKENELDQDSRIKNFKDVYSYNIKMENKNKLK